jgi:uncharacterized repeat protein (TIGR03803 family)
MVLGNDDALYGTTWLGGRNYSGTVFKVALSGPRPIATLLHEFSSRAGGLDPFAGVTLDAHGTIYGTTIIGGLPPNGCGSHYVGCGTVFKLTPSPKGYKESVIHTFVGTDGDQPYGGLVLDKSGDIYGTTAQGGIALGYSGSGTVFKLTPSGSTYTETVLHKFGLGGRDGEYPMSGLVLGKKGVLYGTTYWGGNPACSCGTVFKLTPSGSGYTETVLHRFSGLSDGCLPRAGLTEKDGVLYGTANGCGAAAGHYYGAGTVFQISP